MKPIRPRKTRDEGRRPSRVERYLAHLDQLSAGVEPTFTPIGDEPPRVTVIRYVLAPSLLRRTFAEHARQEAVVRSSDLDWTIVRAGVLTDGQRTGDYRHGFPPDERSLKIKVARADVADFILGVLTGGGYVRGVPSVSH